MARSLWLRNAAIVAVACAACAPKAPAKQTVSLRLSGTPNDARVTIDDEWVGSLDVVSVRGVALPPGSHRISVERAGFFPCDRVVEAKAGAAPIVVQCSLDRLPE